MCLFSIITYYSNYVSKIKFLTEGLLDQELYISMYLCSNLMGIFKL